jgi:hypothetical protein
MTRTVKRCAEAPSALIGFDLRCVGGAWNRTGNHRVNQDLPRTSSLLIESFHVFRLG